MISRLEFFASVTRNNNLPPDTVPPRPVSIVTINYRTPEITLQCLASIAAANIENVSVTIIDNNSGDNSVSLIEAEIASSNWTWAHVISSPVNTGFSGGNNLKLRDQDSDYFLLLNSDTMIRPGAIEILRETMDANPEIGMASPRLEWEDGTPQGSCFRFIRPPYELIKYSGTGIVARLLPRYVTPIPFSNEACSPEWASFACIMIRREVFADIGFLDEKFFMYFEDTDFCYRARKAGWNILYNPEARVVHLRGKSSPLKSLMAAQKRLPRYFYESRSYYFYKNFGRLGLCAANVFWVSGWLLAMLRTLVDRKFESPSSKMQWRDIWINFLRPDAPYTPPEKNR